MTVRVAVIGLGKMGVLHASILNKTPGAALVGVMDVKRDQEPFVRSTGIRCPFYISLEDLLERAQPHAAFVCVPPAFTLRVADPCLRHDVAVFLEKPMAHSLENAATLLRLGGQHSNLPLGVGYVTGHVPTFRRAAELLAQNAIGQIRTISASIYVGAIFARVRGWVGNRDLAGGGAVAQVGSHLIYTLCTLFGAVEEVRASLEYRHNDVEDGAHIALRFVRGCTAEVRLAWDAESYPTYALSVHAVGDSGQIVATNRELRVTTQVDATERGLGLHAAELPNRAPFYFGGDGYADEDLEFIECVAAARKPTVTWQDGYAVQQVIDAIYHSAVERTSVRLKVES